MSDEVLFFSGAVLVLLTGAALLGGSLAGRVRLAPVPLLAVLAAAAVLLTVLTGPLGGRSAAVGLAVLLWGVLLLATVLVAQRLRPALAVAVAVLGGVAATQAAMVAFVVARFSATEAPREYALLWLPAAMTGGVTDLGEPGSGVETPLWVRMSEDAGLLPFLVLLLSGFAVALVIRRRALARRADAPA
ncbi:hypothetical protein [Micromonospora sp. WMMD812]|uniref:hypothetical protein n=1 Tax=Micromonospora sp. WMMD812 TaxID=3015152 RepID=UPI00248C8AAB|nr:hypothetical protein [Micromonospora sp. WMMD812]WBB66820.1 hypothetical protein O7603_27370 [Micromonospora sp. WMMD812]